VCTSTQQAIDITSTFPAAINAKWIKKEDHMDHEALAHLPQHASRRQAFIKVAELVSHVL